MIELVFLARAVAVSTDTGRCRCRRSHRLLVLVGHRVPAFRILLHLPHFRLEQRAPHQLRIDGVLDGLELLFVLEAQDLVEVKVDEDLGAGAAAGTGGTAAAEAVI